MLLNKTEILDRINPKQSWEKRLVVEPFLNTSQVARDRSPSLDFHLGNRFRTLKRSRLAQCDLLDDSPEIPSAEVYVPFGGRYMVHPGELVLATTLEWFRFPRDVIAFVQGRSIWGRSGLVVVTAALIQPRSSSNITLELTNQGAVSLALSPGAAVGQLVFFAFNAESRDVVNHCQFLGDISPEIGKYKKSEVEKYYLSHDGGVFLSSDNA